MANSLYTSMRTQNDGGISQLKHNLMKFKSQFQGNPKQMVENLLQTGQMSQAEFNQLSQQANQLLEAFRKN